MKRFILSPSTNLPRAACHVVIASVLLLSPALDSKRRRLEVWPSVTLAVGKHLFSLFRCAEVASHLAIREVSTGTILFLLIIVPCPPTTCRNRFACLFLGYSSLLSLCSSITAYV